MADLALALQVQVTLNHSTSSSTWMRTQEHLKYHKKRLQACGVLMGHNGYEVHDLHSEAQGDDVEVDVDLVQMAKPGS